MTETKLETVTVGMLREGDRVCGRPGSEGDPSWCAVIVAIGIAGDGRRSVIFRGEAYAAPYPPAAFSSLTLPAGARAHRIVARPLSERHEHGCGCVSEYRGGWIGWAHVTACADHPMEPVALVRP